MTNKKPNLDPLKDRLGLTQNKATPKATVHHAATQSIDDEVERLLGDEQHTEYDEKLRDTFGVGPRRDVDPADGPFAYAHGPSHGEALAQSQLTPQQARALNDHQLAHEIRTANHHPTMILPINVTISPTINIDFRSLLQLDLEEMTNDDSLRGIEGYGEARRAMDKLLNGDQIDPKTLISLLYRLAMVLKDHKRHATRFMKLAELIMNAVM